MDCMVRLSEHAEDLLRAYGETLFPTQPQALRFFLYMPHEGAAQTAITPRNSGAPMTQSQHRWRDVNLRSLQAPKVRAIFAPVSSALAGH